jgi:hypothetical protein
VSFEGRQHSAFQDLTMCGIAVQLYVCNSPVTAQLHAGPETDVAAYLSLTLIIR